MKDSGTSKAKSIRKQRDFCSKYKSIQKSKPYQVIADWQEDNVGTVDMEFRITLKQGYSFSPDEHDPTKGFCSADKAIVAVRNSYVCVCPFCCKPLR